MSGCFKDFHSLKALDVGKHIPGTCQLLRDDLSFIFFTYSNTEVILDTEFDVAKHVLRWHPVLYLLYVETFRH